MSSLSPLIELQSIDQKIRELNQIIVDIPIRKNNETQRLAELQNALNAAQSGYQKAQQYVDEAELEVNSLRDKVVKLRQQQMTLKTNKEFKAMELEIATVEQAIDRQENIQLQNMDRLDPERKQVEACQARLDEEQSVVDEYIADLDAQMTDAQERVAELDKSRQTAAEQVDPELLSVYQRLSAGKWPVLVRFEGDSCGGCHMKQPPAVKHLARRNDGTANCQFCGRLLYE